MATFINKTVPTVSRAVLELFAKFDRNVELVDFFLSIFSIFLKVEKKNQCADEIEVNTKKICFSKNLFDFFVSNDILHFQFTIFSCHTFLQLLEKDKKTCFNCAFVKYHMNEIWNLIGFSCQFYLWLGRNIRSCTYTKNLLSRHKISKFFFLFTQKNYNSLDGLIFFHWEYSLPNFPRRLFRLFTITKKDFRFTETFCHQNVSYNMYPK